VQGAAAPLMSVELLRAAAATVGIRLCIPDPELDHDLVSKGAEVGAEAEGGVSDG
jgi:hypothetical protein